jgi:hypothetical protein
MRFCRVSNLKNIVFSSPGGHDNRRQRAHRLSCCGNCAFADVFIIHYRLLRFCHVLVLKSRHLRFCRVSNLRKISSSSPGGHDNRRQRAHSLSCCAAIALLQCFHSQTIANLRCCHVFCPKISSYALLPRFQPKKHTVFFCRWP